MAFPTIAQRTETPITTSATSLTINFTQTTGDLVVIFLGLNDTAQSLSTVGDSFTNLTNTNATFHILSKVLTGSEGGNMVVTVGTTTRAAAIAYNIQGHHPGITPEFSTVATGTSTDPDPGTVTPTGGAKDYLWLAAFRQNGEEADDDTWCNSAPTNFGNLTQTTAGTAGATTLNGSVASADFASNASSMDPGTFNTDQSLAWRAYTVAVHPVTVLTRTTDDAVTLAESLARLGTFLRSITDSVTSSDSVARAATLLRSISDSISFADSVVASKIIMRTIADSITHSDTVARVGTFVRTATDSSTYADATTRIETLLRDITDSTTLSDAGTRIQTSVRNAVDALVFGDFVNRAITSARIAADSISFSESVDGFKVILRTAVDALGLADAAEVIRSIVRDAVDALGLADIATRIITSAGAAAAVIPKIIMRTSRRTPRLRGAIVSRRKR